MQLGCFAKLITVLTVRMYYNMNSIIRLAFHPSRTTTNNLGPSYRMDLDFWNCLEEKKQHLIAKLHKADLKYFKIILEKKNIPFNIITVFIIM